MLPASNISSSSLSVAVLSCMMSMSSIKFSAFYILKWFSILSNPSDSVGSGVSGAVPGGVVAGLRYPLIISLINTEFQGFVAGLEPPGLVWGYRVPGAPCSLLLLNDVLLDETWPINIKTRPDKINSSNTPPSQPSLLDFWDMNFQTISRWSADWSDEWWMLNVWNGLYSLILTSRS